MKNTLEEKLNLIFAKLTAFSRAKYLKADVEAELRKLQHEILVIVFDEAHALNAHLTIWDAYNHLAQINAERGGIADEILAEFKEQCKIFSNLIRAEISGNKGENHTAHRLSFLHGINRIVRNIQLSNEDGTTELDFVVFTPKAAFILEVKNTKKDVLIDEIGDYYRVGEYTNRDSNMKAKMDFRETLLREALAETMGHRNKDMKVVKLVVFTNKNITLHNKCKELQTCFLGQLPYLIEDYEDADLYTEEDIAAMAEAVSLADNAQEYEFEMDMQRFKEDFATILVTLETAEEKEECVEGPVIVEKVVPEATLQDKQENGNHFWEVLGLISSIAVTIGVGAVISKALVKR